MIDIVKAVQEADPSLGAYVIVLRSDSRALNGPERLNPEAEAWLSANAPGGRLVRMRIRLAPHPGAVPAEREVTVMAFAEARELAAFATTWTGDPLTDEE